MKIFNKRQTLWKSKVFNDNQYLGCYVSRVSNELFEIYRFIRIRL